MDEFSYLSVILSIILGLAITQILQGFRGLMQSRARVRLYWPALAWAAILLLVYVQSWWAMFGLRRQENWNFAGFAIVLLHITLLYMLAGLVLPDFPPNEPVDLRENYYAHHKWLFGIAVLSVLASLGKDLVLSGSLPNRTNVVFHLIFFVIALVGAVTRREWYHKTAAVLMAVLFVFYTAILFEYLR
jgi:hypothetical protein